MPSLVALLKEVAFLKMTSFGEMIPFDWKQPMGDPDQDHFGKAFTLSEHLSGALVMLGAEVVGPATTNKYHGDAAKEVSKWYKDFMDEATAKIKSAVDSWRPKVKFKSVQVMALSGIGSGVLDAPDIKNEPAFSAWKGKEKNAKAYNKAVIEGFSKPWMDFAKAVTLPGLPLWPAFCAFPGPMAPPMPVIPMPLIAYISPKMTAVAMASDMKKAMIDALDKGVKDEDGPKHHEKIFESIATAVTLATVAWLPMQMVMNLMGKGPIPTFAPPVVPVGPVVAGDVLPTPGPLAA